jgi:hypothetical protein
MKRLVTFTVFAVLFFAASSTQANITFVADYVEGQSWSPGYWFITDNTTDHMQMMVSVSGGLESPALTSYGSPGLGGQRNIQ